MDRPYRHAVKLAIGGGGRRGGRNSLVRAGVTCLGGASLCLALPDAIRADQVDKVVAVEMREHHIPGLSLAIIDGGKIVKAQGYGFADQVGKTPVTTSTLFQAGSVSKSVAAVGALRLVEQGRLSLDEDVNGRLRSWKVPENEFTKDKKVTLRRILSHTSGFTVHGFPGYAANTPLPSLTQVLDGAKPANTPAIRVELEPGGKWQYSGGGYTVMQQLLIDVTGRPFPEFMQATVLKPCGMNESTYEQPLPEKLRSATAAGHRTDGSEVAGRWHVYPEMAAAGLWTTPSDLARFAISIQQSLAGKPDAVLSQAMARRMLVNQRNNDGLGVFLGGNGKTLRFFHDGRDAGFDASMNAYAETGQGAVIMINANNDSSAVLRVMFAIGKEYRWE